MRRLPTLLHILPVANDAKGSDYTYAQGNHDRPSLKLGGAAKLASWATPAAHEAGGTPARFLERKVEANAKGSSLGVSLTSLSLQAQCADSGSEFFSLAQAFMPGTSDPMMLSCTPFREKRLPRRSRVVPPAKASGRRPFGASTSQA